MKNKKEHLEFDLDFLDQKEAPRTTPSKTPSLSSTDSPTPPPVNPVTTTVPTGYKVNWKNILIIGGIVLFFGWAMFSGSSDTSTNNYAETAITRGGNTLPPPVLDTSSFESDTPTVPKVKTDSQICKADYGSHSYATGNKTATGGPECDCQTGYIWNDGQTTCVVAPPPPKTGYEICQERNGVNATYDSASNSCGCTTGYYFGATSQRCVGLIESRNQTCEAKYLGTSYLKADPTDGHYICDCKAGYDWNNDRTACYTTASFTQSCVNAYGTGAYSTTENGKRVCDCGYSYSFNAQRNMCVTTASINAICERDVGRNSRYSGTVTNGKYDCTQPY